MNKIKKWLFPVFKLIYLIILSKLTRKIKNSVFLIADFGQFGGTRTYFFYLIRLLSKLGYTVTVELSSEQKDEDVLNLLQQTGSKFISKEYDFGNIYFNNNFFSKFNINPSKKTIHALNHYLQTFIKTRSSIIIVSLGTAERLLFLFLLPIKLIYIIHTVVESQLEKIRINWMKHKYKKQILTVSDYSAQAIKKNWKIQKLPVNYVYNFYLKKENYDKIIQHDSINILTIGSLEWYKNPEYWIKIAKIITKKYNNVYFYWLGSGTEFENSIKKTANSDRIIFEGFKQNVEKWYEIADIYFQPSIKESFGISVVGAMCHKIPCVVSNKEGLPEIIKDKETGFLIDLENDKSALDIFDLLVENKNLRLQIGNCGYISYLNSFTYEIWEKEFIKKVKL